MSCTPRSYGVSEIQRARLLQAAAAAVAEVGYERMTVAQVIGRARVSRKTFYSAFADRDDCFLALFEETLAQAAAVTEDAYADKRQWRVRIRAALGSLLVLMEREPAIARLWVIEAVRGGKGVLARRADTLEQLAKLIDGGRADYGGGFGPPDIVAEGVVGGVVQVLHTRLTKPSKEPLVNLLGPLMYMIVLPYLGRRAARSELNGPVPPAARVKATLPQLGEGDPLDGVKMRMTQRTALVLLAIARYPGASNCEVAEAAGILDQGQISKLLGRLARLELVENHGLGQERGAANAWRLTDLGRRVVGATGVRAHALV